MPMRIEALAGCSSQQRHLAAASWCASGGSGPEALTQHRCIPPMLKPLPAAGAADIQYCGIATVPGFGVGARKSGGCL
jgi:hypothetical protein